MHFVLIQQRHCLNLLQNLPVPYSCSTSSCDIPKFHSGCFQAQEDNALLEGIVHSRYQLADGGGSSSLFSGDGLAMMHSPPCISQVVSNDPIIKAAVQQAEMCACFSAFFFCIETAPFVLCSAR